MKTRKVDKYFLYIGIKNMLLKKCQPLGCQKTTHKNIGIEAL